MGMNYKFEKVEVQECDNIDNPIIKSTQDEKSKRMIKLKHTRDKPKDVKGQLPLAENLRKRDFPVNYLGNREWKLAIDNKEINSRNNEISKLEKMIFIMSIIDNELSKTGTKMIIFGDLALSIYTSSEYYPTDINIIVTDRTKAKEVLNNLDFENYSGLWLNRRLNVIVEIFDHQIANYYNEGKLNHVKVNNYNVTIIGIEDIIIDKLYSGIMFKTNQDKALATELYGKHKEKVDKDYLMISAKRLGIIDKLNIIINK